MGVDVGSSLERKTREEEGKDEQEDSSCSHDQVRLNHFPCFQPSSSSFSAQNPQGSYLLHNSSSIQHTPLASTLSAVAV